MKYRPASITVINFVLLYTQVETKQEYEKYFWVLVELNVVELFLYSWKEFFFWEFFFYNGEKRNFERGMKPLKSIEIVSKNWKENLRKILHEIFVLFGEKSCIKMRSRKLQVNLGCTWAFVEFLVKISWKFLRNKFKKYEQQFKDSGKKSHFRLNFVC